MRVQYFPLALSCALLIGCGAAQTFGAAPSQMSSLIAKHQSANHGPMIYVSEFEGDIFYGYRLPHTSPFCAGPAQIEYAIVDGIGVDSAGTLWVPTNIFGGSMAGSYIFSYAPKCGAQGTTLKGLQGAQPAGIAFGPDGTKYVTMFIQNGTSVAIYPPGATTAPAELNDPRLAASAAQGIGTDRAGRVYVSCCLPVRKKRPSFVIVFKSGQESQSRGKKITLSQISHPGFSVTFDRAKNMILPDIDTNSVKIYAPPYSGNPTTYPLHGSPSQCALSGGENMLACSDYDNQDVDIYAYPSLAYQYSLPGQSSSGVPPGGVAFAR